MKSLRYWCKLYFDTMRGHILILQDSDGHYSMLYHADGRLAHTFQTGYSPIVYPTPKYKVIELLSVWDLARVRKLYNIS